MNAWSHLPNAGHIDRIIASVKAHPEAWAAAWAAAWDAARAAARAAAWDAARNAARAAARDAARDAAWDAARDAARDAAWDAARDATYNAARDSILALIAYDDAAKYLEMSSDQVKIWAELSEEPAAVLLLPAVIAFEKIKETEFVS
jgi:hypothetical protein